MDLIIALASDKILETIWKVQYKGYFKPNATPLKGVLIVNQKYILDKNFFGSLCT